MSKDNGKLPAHEVILDELEGFLIELKKMQGEAPEVFKTVGYSAGLMRNLSILSLQTTCEALFVVLAKMKLPEKHYPEIAERLRRIDPSIFISTESRVKLRKLIKELSSAGSGF